MQNIEFKAELRNLAAARRQCELLDAQCVRQMQQTDTYFRLPDGRLKKREVPGELVEWIFYHRQDRVSPRMSNYTILNNEQARRRWGTQSLKPWLTVVKTRELWMLGDVRIHLDEVEELGTFIEFEALVSRRFDVKMCHEAVRSLRETFSPLLGESISKSYSDLVEQTLAEKR
jgi:adenylate cyclase, class 2